jgi:hypothetical protein
MSTYPDIGMKYEQGIKTAIRHSKEGSQRIVESMANQVRSYEGEKAAREFRREAEAKARENNRKYFT